jgi:hypothetical protein
MSEIKVNKISPKQTCTQLTLGDSGDTIIIPAGVNLNTEAIKNLNTSSIITQTNATTITLGFSGATIAVASGASQTGFGRTGAVNWDTTAKTSSPVTAVSGTGYFINTTSGAITVNLPTTPSAGDIVGICDYAGTAATNNITIGRNGSKIEGQTENSSIKVNNGSRTLIYVDATQGWKVIDDATTTLITAYEADYFVLAGGGGGGYATAAYGTGGGGGGGFRNSYDTPLVAPAGLTVISGTSYPITVGAGGAAGPSSNPRAGNSGTPSVFSTITSTGGGGGAGPPGNPGTPGGSGGGGAYDATGFGTGNTPPVSPPQGNSGQAGQGASGRGEGGGGAGSVGNSGSGNTGGPGGSGLATSISGTPTTKGAGGPGGSYVNSPAGGGSQPANSGNGGGGTGCNRSAADGGSGIVVIRYATASAPPATSGGTKTTSGSDTIHTFTGPGTFVA